MEEKESIKSLSCTEKKVEKHFFEVPKGLILADADSPVEINIQQTGLYPSEIAPCLSPAAPALHPSCSPLCSVEVASSH